MGRNWVAVAAFGRATAVVAAIAVQQYSAQLYELGKPASRGDAHPQVVPGVTEPAGML